MTDGGTVVGGNQRDGRLMRIAKDLYLGERPKGKGKFETRRFKGSKAAAFVEWSAWWSETQDPEMLKSNIDEWHRLADKCDGAYKTARLRKRAQELANARARAASADAGASEVADTTPEPDVAAEISHDGKELEEDMAQKADEGRDGAAALPETVYVLSYRSGRSSKLVAAYLSDTTALEMADALGMAICHANAKSLIQRQEAL